MGRWEKEGERNENGMLKHLKSFASLPAPAVALGERGASCSCFLGSWHESHERTLLNVASIHSWEALCNRFSAYICQPVSLVYCWAFEKCGIMIHKLRKNKQDFLGAV